jgi:hypothetical protein
MRMARRWEFISSWIMTKSSADRADTHRIRPHKQLFAKEDRKPDMLIVCLYPLFPVQSKLTGSWLAASP